MKTFTAAALAAVASASLMSSTDYKFMRFVTEHGKRYGTTEEFEARKAHFIRADQEFELINSNPESKMIAGHNKFSDYSPEEYNRMMGLRNMPLPTGNEGIPQTFSDDLSVPSSVDWRKEGKVTAVKDQGSCGSCWAFSSTGALESAFAIKDGTLESLSEQQLVDCSTAYGNNGCGGGWYFWSYDYLIGGGNTKYMETEANYKYTGRDGTCKY